MKGISRITVAASILLAVLLNCGCNAMYARPLPVSSAEQSVSAISESAAEEISSDETASDKSETSWESADSPEEQSAGGDNARHHPNPLPWRSRKARSRRKQRCLRKAYLMQLTYRRSARGAVRACGSPMRQEQSHTAEAAQPSTSPMRHRAM